MDFICHFFTGAFLCNAIPHLVAGMQGSPFPSPFAKPHGVGLSSPVVNVVWASLNLVAAMALLHHRPFAVDLNAATLAFCLGFFSLAIFCSLHFGKVMAQRQN